MDKVVHFEIPADDIERAGKFYKDNFGWVIQSMPEMDYTIVRTVEVDKDRLPIESGAINGGIMKRNGNFKAPVVVISVNDINSYLEKIEKSGGKTVVKKMPVGDMGFIAYIKDNEGNVIGLWQNRE